ncbi:MAG: Stp1/IreP family PP2C-type Ser/Thr phosphatase [Collinsella sp.]
MARAKRKKSGATFGSRTDVGCVREHNEDSLAVALPLYVVCDGMGGHAAGEVASEIAVDVICDRAPAHPDASALGQAVEEANLAIIRAAREGVGRAGMGCTCTAAMLEKDKLVIAQVGDSRAYLLHKGQMQQLTRDHSLVADLIEAGQITEAEARVHPQRSVITRALGSDPRTQPDFFEITVEAGDRLLLCSDGLSTMLEDDQIAKILANHSEPQRCAAQLVNEAVGRGGYDNVTVIVVDVTGLAEQHRRKLTRKSRATAIMLALLLVAIIAGCAYGFNYPGVQRRLSGGSGWEGRRVPGRSRRPVRAIFQSPRSRDRRGVRRFATGHRQSPARGGHQGGFFGAANSLVAEYEKEIADRKAAEEEAARAAAEANQPAEPAKGAEGAGGSTVGGEQGGTDSQGTEPSAGWALVPARLARARATPALARTAHGRAAAREEPTDDPAQHRADVLLIASPIVIVLFAMMVVTGGQELSFNTLGVPLGIFAAFLVAHIAVRLLAPRPTQLFCPFRSRCRASASPSLPALCPIWP